MEEKTCLLSFFTGVYSFGCYQTKRSNRIFRGVLSTSLTGTDVIQQCITRAKRVTSRNYQGIGIRLLRIRFRRRYYGCFADENAEQRYTLYGPANNCGSDGVGAPGSNATAVFLFSGEH